jgi:hypothetical protein
MQESVRMIDGHRRAPRRRVSSGGHYGTCQIHHGPANEYLLRYSRIIRYKSCVSAMDIKVRRRVLSRMSLVQLDLSGWPA